MRLYNVGTPLPVYTVSRCRRKVVLIVVALQNLNITNNLMPYVVKSPFGLVKARWGLVTGMLGHVKARLSVVKMWSALFKARLVEVKVLLGLVKMW